MDAILEIDSATGKVTARIPSQDRDKLFARLNISSDLSPLDDRDNDGIPNWLEDYVDTLNEGVDNDGDGVSSQVEKLIGADPHDDEFAEQQTQEASFATGLSVFTPLPTTH